MSKITLVFLPLLSSLAEVCSLIRSSWVTFISFFKTNPIISVIPLNFRLFWKKLVFFIGAIFSKTVLNWFQMSNKGSRVTNFISGPFEFFCLFIVTYMAYINFRTLSVSCNPLEWSVGDNLSISVWNHTEEKVDRNVSSHIYSLLGPKISLLRWGQVITRWLKNDRPQKLT